jgi:hypothetical protein
MSSFHQQQQQQQQPPSNFMMDYGNFVNPNDLAFSGDNPLSPLGQPVTSRQPG